MNIIIITDLEGIIGFDSSLDTSKALELWVQNLTVILKLLQEYLPNNHITICDVHNNGFYSKEIAKRISELKMTTVRVIGGIDTLLNNLVIYDVGLLIGFHGKAGAKGRFSHSFRDDFVHILAGEQKKPVGEIYLFIHLLKYYNIPVVFVSGEGGISDEIEQGIIYYQTEDIHDIKEDLFTFSEIARHSMHSLVSFALKNDIQEMDAKRNDEVIRIEVDNLDKISYAENAGFIIENNQIVFLNIISFFSNVVRLAHVMNEANCQIYKRNLQFAYTINKYKDKLLLDMKIIDILKKPLNLLDNGDLYNIKTFLLKVTHDE